MSRGFFLSVTAVLILVIVIAITLSVNRTSSSGRDLAISRERARAVSLAVERMHATGIPAATALALKESVDALGSSLAPGSLEALSRTGGYGSATIAHPLSSIEQHGIEILNDPIALSVTDYHIAGIAQRDAFTLDVTVDLTVRFDNPQLSGNLTYTDLVVPVSIVGAQDPYAGSGLITKNGYRIDSSRPCYLKAADPAASCVGPDGSVIDGVSPLSTT